MTPPTAQSGSAAALPVQPEVTWIGHPRGLLTLFMTEMWERFSYYGMRALLVLFMVAAIQDGGMGLTDQTATAIYGLYTAAVYLLSLPGGWMADRLLGAQRAIWYGGIVIMSGHFTLAIPGVTTFFLGLVLIALGTGLLKPNISAVVGELYPPGDPRRDGGFTIYYMGINLGAFLGPLACGWLAAENWHYGFAAAGVGMFFGLIQFALTRKHMGTAGLEPARSTGVDDTIFRRRAWITVCAALAVVGVLLAGGLTGMIQYDAISLSRSASYVIVTVTVAFFAFILGLGRLKSGERGRIITIAVLIFAATVFWAGFEQAGSSLNLFAERYTLREFGNFTVPATWFQALNPAFILILAPVYSMMWLALARRQLDPNPVFKAAMGLIMLGLGFAVMIAAAQLVVRGDTVLPTWLIFTYLLHTMGELALSPVGLSAVTRLSPRRYVGQMMGAWFLSASLGAILAGLIAGEFRADAVETMPGLYTQIVLTSVGIGLLLAVASVPLKRLLRNSR